MDLSNSAKYNSCIFFLQDFIPNADICMGQGDLRCGACECHAGFLGKNCQCKEGDMNIPDTDEKNCIPPNATETVVCSGQGKCECGQCVCNKRPDPAEVTPLSLVSSQYDKNALSLS